MRVYVCVWVFYQSFYYKFYVEKWQVSWKSSSTNWYPFHLYLITFGSFSLERPLFMHLIKYNRIQCLFIGCICIGLRTDQFTHLAHNWRKLWRTNLIYLINNARVKKHNCTLRRGTLPKLSWQSFSYQQGHFRPGLCLCLSPCPCRCRCCCFYSCCSFLIQFSDSSGVFGGHWNAWAASKASITDEGY